MLLLVAGWAVGWYLAVQFGSGSFWVWLGGMALAGAVTAFALRLSETSLGLVGLAVIAAAWAVSVILGLVIGFGIFRGAYWTIGVVGAAIPCTVTGLFVRRAANGKPDAPRVMQAPPEQLRLATASTTPLIATPTTMAKTARPAVFAGLGWALILTMFGYSAFAYYIRDPLQAALIGATGGLVIGITFRWIEFRLPWPFMLMLSAAWAIACLLPLSMGPVYLTDLLLIAMGLGGIVTALSAKWTERSLSLSSAAAIATAWALGLFFAARVGQVLLEMSAPLRWPLGINNLIAYGAPSFVGAGIAAGTTVLVLSAVTSESAAQPEGERITVSKVIGPVLFAACGWALVLAAFGESVFVMYSPNLLEAIIVGAAGGLFVGVALRWMDLPIRRNWMLVLTAGWAAACLLPPWLDPFRQTWLLLIGMGVGGLVTALTLRFAEPSLSPSALAAIGIAWALALFLGLQIAIPLVHTRTLSSIWIPLGVLGLVGAGIAAAVTALLIDRARRLA